MVQETAGRSEVVLDAAQDGLALGDLLQIEDAERRLEPARCDLRRDLARQLVRRILVDIPHQLPHLVRELGGSCQISRELFVVGCRLTGEYIHSANHRHGQQSGGAPFARTTLAGPVCWSTARPFSEPTVAAASLMDL